MIAPVTEASPRRKAHTALDALCEALSKERPLAFLVIGSFAAACVFWLCVFDIPFLLGTASFWNNPRGILPHSWADISTALSGYFYFQRDAWQWPLFHVDKLGAPAGTNIIFTDSIPWVALAGRLVFRATGLPVNLYGLWIAFCFAASAMALTALVATLGQRNIAAAAMATITGLCMPALLARWGHMSLMAQFEIPLALIFYLRNQRGGKAWSLFVQGSALIWLTLWTHAYLFVMVGAVVLATIAQAVSNRALRGGSAALVLAGLGTITVGIMALSGYLQSGGSLGAEGLGVFSMNLLSPFLPQRSGLYAALRNVIADGTGGQYEGFSYLGIGILMLLLMTLPWQMGKLRERWRRHPWIGLLFFGFTLSALSNIVFLGPVQLIDIPLPGRVLQFAAMFRSSGRFFWPVMYGIAALAITAPIAFYGRRGALLLCLAMPLQWMDSAPLRQTLAASARVPEKPHIDLTAWEAAIERHNSVRVLPQYACLGLPTAWNHEIAVQIQLLAARADRPVNTVYTARPAADCRGDQRISGIPQPGTRQLSIFLDKFSGFAQLQKLAASSNMCSAGDGIIVCSDIPGETETLQILTRTARK